MTFGAFRAHTKFANFGIFHRPNEHFLSPYMQKLVMGDPQMTSEGAFGAKNFLGANFSISDPPNGIFLPPNMQMLQILVMGDTQMTFGGVWAKMPVFR